MTTAAAHLMGWLMGKVKRPVRSQRRRRTARMKRQLSRLVANLSFGFLLVGCANMPTASDLPEMPFVNRVKVDDPIKVLQESPDPRYRLAAYRRLQDPSTLPPEMQGYAPAALMEGLQKETSPLARATVVRALAAYPSEETRKVLVDAVTDQNPLVRSEVCAALGRFEDDAVIGLLGRVSTNDRSVDVRLAATEALVAMNDARCNEALLECLLDDDIIIAQRAASGLQAVTNENLGTNYDAWESYLATGEVPEDFEPVQQAESLPLYKRLWR